MVAMQVSKQELVDALRRTGFPEVADEFQRVLPDPVDLDQAAQVADRYGITKSELISRMGGSP